MLRRHYKVGSPRRPMFCGHVRLSVPPLAHCTSGADAFDAPQQITHLAFHQYFIKPIPNAAFLSDSVNQRRLGGGWRLSFAFRGWRGVARKNPN